MQNIKTYKDGNRLVIVVENCTGELATKVNRFILDALGMPEISSDDMPEQAKPVAVPAIVPEVVAEEKIELDQCTPITASEEKPFEEPIPLQAANDVAVKGGSGTLGNAIRNKDTVAIVELVAKDSKTMNESTRTSVLALCKTYIREDCIKRDPYYATTAEIQKFFEIYEPLLTNSIQQILGSVGYANMRDFFGFTDEHVHQDAYASVLESLIERTSNQ